MGLIIPRGQSFSGHVVQSKFFFPALSPRIRQRSELTERDWENAVRGLGKSKLWYTARSHHSTESLMVSKMVSYL